jgi:hypothetical protein
MRSLKARGATFVDIFTKKNPIAKILKEGIHSSEESNEEAANAVDPENPPASTSPSYKKNDGDRNGNKGSDDHSDGDENSRQQQQQQSDFRSKFRANMRAKYLGKGKGVKKRD